MELFFLGADNVQLLQQLFYVQTRALKHTESRKFDPLSWIGRKVEKQHIKLPFGPIQKRRRKRNRKYMQEEARRTHRTRANKQQY